ncbi:YgcG family protein [Massilia sp. METH4]|uniref:TPM domain-containing protein n=1 Tax=Massilia sp. METH4 TaxID=3123041 RepID=UPI0030CF2941
MPLGPQDDAAPPAAPRRRTREHPSEGKWLGTAEVTNERDVRDVRGHRRGLGRLVPRPSKKWLEHWLVRYALLVLLLFVSLLFVEAARAQEAQPSPFVPVPELKARVTDQANLLTPQQRAALESVLADHETRTGSQIAILTVNSTAPEPIEQYSIRVTDAWKLGRKGVDDGVLVLVAKDNPSSLRRLRIEAGRGVQGVLTDAQSKRVLQDVIAPHFRNNDYYGGLSAGVSAIATLLDKEHFPAPEAQPAPRQAQADSGGGWFWPAILFGLFVLLPMFRGRGRRRSLHRSGWGSDAAGVLIGSALGSALGNAHRHGGGFGGGGFGGGGFGGFGGGGGGTFDGGGASGDW